MSGIEQDAWAPQPDEQVQIIEPNPCWAQLSVCPEGLHVPLGLSFTAERHSPPPCAQIVSQLAPTVLTRSPHCPGETSGHLSLIHI